MEGGLKSLLVTMRPELLRFLRARGAGDEAEDLLQELWIKIDGMATRPIGEPVAYLHRMADNLLIDRRRSAVRQQQREELWSELTEPGGQGSSGEPAADRRLLAREELRRVQDRLASLGGRTEAIFRRFRIDGIGHRQIAAECGLSVSAVEKNLRKAYRVLLSLQEEDADTGKRLRLAEEGAADDAD